MESPCLPAVQLNCNASALKGCCRRGATGVNGIAAGGGGVIAYDLEVVRAGTDRVGDAEIIAVAAIVVAGQQRAGTIL